MDVDRFEREFAALLQKHGCPLGVVLALEADPASGVCLRARAWSNGTPASLAGRECLFRLVTAGVYTPDGQEALARAMNRGQGEAN